jgi:hypothetical protein
MRRRKLLWLLPLNVVMLHGQTQVDLRSQARNIDFTNAATSKPFKSGTALPSVCGVGEQFFKLDAAAGTNLYSCTATNVWTQEGGMPAYRGAGAPSGACITGSVYSDTVGSTTWFCESPLGWRRVLATTDNGAFSILGQNGPLPTLPPSGNTVLYFSSIAKLGKDLGRCGERGHDGATGELCLHAAGGAIHHGGRGGDLWDSRDHPHVSGRRRIDG